MQRYSQNIVSDVMLLSIQHSEYSILVHKRIKKNFIGIIPECQEVFKNLEIFATDFLNRNMYVRYSSARAGDFVCW